jgi:hypothetical protein
MRRLRRRPASLVVLAALLLAAAHPPAALAHAGGTAPHATSFLARVRTVPAGVAAQAVDGDQQLWLEAAPNATVIVTGLRGEPYLRFARDGVAVNQRSATWYLNRALPVSPPPGLTPGTKPDWHPVTSGHAYLWHEDRLHALSAAARAPGPGAVGTWAVPLTVDGRPGRVTGSLTYEPPPSPVWFWPIVVAAACAWALIRLRRAPLEAAIGTATAVLVLATVVVAHVGSDFLGRPTVSASAVASFAGWCATSAIAVALLIGRRRRQIGALAAAVLGLTTGLGFVATLTHGYVLAVLPAALVRVTTVVALAGSVVLVLLIFFGQTRWTKDRVTPAAGRGRRARSPRA